MCSKEQEPSDVCLHPHTALISHNSVASGGPVSSAVCLYTATTSKRRGSETDAHRWSRLQAYIPCCRTTRDHSQGQPRVVRPPYRLRLQIYVLRPRHCGLQHGAALQPAPHVAGRLTRQSLGIKQEERAAALATAQAAQKEAERQLAAARQARADAAAAGAAVEARAAEVEQTALAAERRAVAAEAEMEALQREHQDRQKRCVITMQARSVVRCTRR